MLCPHFMHVRGWLRGHGRSPGTSGPTPGSGTKREGGGGPGPQAAPGIPGCYRGKNREISGGLPGAGDRGWHWGALQGYRERHRGGTGDNTRGRPGDSGETPGTGPGGAVGQDPRGNTGEYRERPRGSIPRPDRTHTCLPVRGGAAVVPRPPRSRHRHPPRRTWRRHSVPMDSGGSRWVPVSPRGSCSVRAPLGLVRLSHGSARPRSDPLGSHSAPLGPAVSRRAPVAWR